MNKHYNHQKLEKKWQEVWESQKVFVAESESKKPKYYALCMFPYPSAQGLHVGHPESYTALDIVARYRMMLGYNVLNPIGWDAFGLPAENYAIKMGVPPSQTTKENIANFTRQIKALGFSYDWSREINTSDPSYYKWTQWMFLQLYKNGLAYKKKAKVNWCDDCQTVLANEQVIDGKCERCHKNVRQKDLEQWFFKITDYAQKLIDGLEDLDWPEHIKISQRNWIGRSEGAELEFKIKNQDLVIKVFTTRPDTLYGATYMVLAPEHELVEQLKDKISNWDEVEKYQVEAGKKSELQRTDLNKEKTGVELQGIKVINPANNKEIPVYIADYVLTGYGTGAIMAVPAHDQRDFEFAKQFNLDIIPVIKTDNKKTVLVLHGTAGSSKKNWYPWLEQELLKQGINVIVPDMPNSEKPNLEVWLDYLKKIKKDFSDELIIVGHSLGCPTALQFIENNKLHVSKLYLIAPTHPKMNWKQIEETHDLEQSKCIKEVTNAGYNASKINKFVKETHIFLSEDDKYIPYDVLGLFKDLDPVEHIYKDMGHFNKSTKNMLDFPDLLDELLDKAYEAEGEMINSDEFDGMDNETAKQKITKKVGGEMKIQYRLRDWLVSRQRYWGAPIPIIYCLKCGEQPVPEENLPVKLPEDVDFKPTGESPLVYSQDFHQVECPKCGGDARREVDTMDTFVCSSWYYLRYLDAKNSKEPFSKDLEKYWLPIDLYIGGAEHANGHLIFSRFFHKVLFELKHVTTPEPFQKLKNQGMILGEDGQKMSKSRGNVINPDEVVDEFGADTMRLYEMFMGPLEDTKPWSTKGIIGIRRFLEKVWLVTAEWLEHGMPGQTSAELKKTFHKTVKKVTSDIGAMKFNTAISAMMILINQMAKEKNFTKSELEMLLLIISPFAPHLAEELWQEIGNKNLIIKSSWPEWQQELTVDQEVDVIVQVNGKVRGKITVSKDIKEDNVYQKAQAEKNVKKFLADKKMIKKIYIANKLVNFVVK